MGIKQFANWIFRQSKVNALVLRSLTERTRVRRNDSAMDVLPLVTKRKIQLVNSPV